MTTEEIIEAFENLRYFESSSEVEWGKVQAEADRAIETLKQVKNNDLLHSVIGILSDEQLERADMWYCLHKNYVNKLYHLAENSFPPTLNEDKNNPALWKAGHWKWYLDNYR